MLSEQTSPPEDIKVAPNALCKGEIEEEVCICTIYNNYNRQNNEQKLKELETKTNEYKPQKTRGICINYRYLNDPFSDEEEEGVFPNIKNNAETIITRDDCHSLKEAKAFLEWPDWECAI